MPTADGLLSDDEAWGAPAARPVAARPAAAGLSGSGLSGSGPPAVGELAAAGAAAGPSAAAAGAGARSAGAPQASVGQRALDSVREGRPAATGDERTPPTRLLTDDEAWGVSPSHTPSVMQQIGAAAQEGAAGLVNIASDPFGNLIGRPLATGIQFAHDALAPVFGYQRFTPQERADLLGDEGLQPGTRAVTAIDRAAGEPTPEDVRKAAPNSTLMDVAGGAAMGAPMGPAGALAGAAGVLGGKALSSVVPEWAQPAADVAGNVVAGGVAGAGEAGMRAAGRGAASAARLTTAPFTEAGREYLVGRRIYNASSDPAAVSANAAGAQDPHGGSTLYQMNPTETKLGELERLARTRNSGAFNAFDANQNAQRVAALGSLDPTNTPPAVIGEAFQQRLKDLDRDMSADVAGHANDVRAVMRRAGDEVAPEVAGAAVRSAIDAKHAPLVAAADEAVAKAGAGVDEALARIGGDPQRMSVQEEGARMRGAPPDADAPGTGLEGVRAPRKAAASALYDAIDPDGKLVVGGLSSVADVARVLRGDAPRGNGFSLPSEQIASLQKFAAPAPGAMAPGEAAILNHVADLPDVAKFSDVQKLSSWVSDALRSLRRDPGRESVPFVRMSKLQDALHGVLGRLAEERAVSDASAVRNGILAPQDTLAAKMNTAGVGAADAPKVGDTAYTPSGRGIGVRYRLAEADDLIPSQDEYGRPNPAYPQELQPRDRTRAASRLQVNAMANRLEPERLGASASTAEGAPIVGPDGVVESGNGRALAIRQAYQDNPERAEAYRQWLASQGYDISGMRNPVLVRERTTPVGSMAERAALTDEMGASPVLGMSAGEKASADAKRLSADTLEQWRGGDVTSAANADFVRAFANEVIPEGERAAFITADGMLSTEGAQRVRNALMSRAYGDNALVTRLVEDADPNLKAVGSAMMDAAGDMAKVRAGIETGKIAPDGDLAPALVDLARMVKQARDGGYTIANAAKQLDAFSGQSRLADALLRVTFGPTLMSRANRGKLAKLLNYYADEISVQSGLFGGNLTPAEILEQGVQKYGAGTEAAEPQLRGSAERPGGSADADSAGGRGPVGGAASQAARRTAPRRQAATQTVFAEAPLVPNATAEHAAQVRAANAGWRQYKQDFRSGAVGDVLASGKDVSGYALPHSAVPSRLWAAGPKGAEAADSLIRAVGYDEALKVLGDYPALDMRLSVAPDGKFSPGKYQTWLKNHMPVLQKFPGLLAKLGTPAAAVEVLDKAVADRKALDDAYPIKPGWGDADLMKHYVRTGDGGFEAAGALMDRLAGHADAVKSVVDYLASKLRAAAAVRSGDLAGTLDRGRYNRFMEQYQSFLSHPSMAPVLERFGSIAKAQDALDAAVKAHGEVLAAFQKSAAGKYLGDSDPVTTTMQMLRAPDGAAKFRQLAALVQNDPAARAGIQHAIMEGILRDYLSEIPDPVSGARQIKQVAFLEFVRERAPAMAQIMDRGQMQTIARVAESLKASAVSQRTKLPGGSNTPQDAAIGEAHGERNGSVLGWLGAAEAAGHLMPGGGALGKAVGLVAAGWSRGARAVGLDKASVLLGEAMLRPAVGKKLLDQYMASRRGPTPRALDVIGRSMLAAYATSAVPSSGNP